MKRMVFLITSLMVLCILTGTAAAMGSKPEEPNELKDFYWDGCSFVAPEGYKDDPDLWCECCWEHDKAYYKGGTWEQKNDADIALGECVAEKSGSKILGDLYYAGTAIGAGPYVNVDPTARWGYGWIYNRGYDEISSYDKEIADEKIQLYQEDYEDENGGEHPCSAYTEWNH